MATLPTDFDGFIAYSEGDTGLNENMLLRKAASFAQTVLGFGAPKGAGMALGALSPLTYLTAPMKGAYNVYKTGTLLDKIYALTDKKYASAYKNYKLGTTHYLR